MLINIAAIGADLTLISFHLFNKDIDEIFVGNKLTGTRFSFAAFCRLLLVALSGISSTPFK